MQIPNIIEKVFSGASIKVILIGFIALLFVSGCATKNARELLAGKNAEELYETGQQSLQQKRYKDAIMNFEVLQSNYPYSEFAEKSHRDLIYVYYESGDYVGAATSADRFTRLYPTSPDIAYVYYIKGLANFSQDRGVFARILPMDISYRDLGTQAEAYTDFEMLVNLYPDSPYTADARQRMVYLRNLMAERELKIAGFYMERHMYVAASNRASNVVTNYSESPQVEEALVMMVEANRKLGLEESADDAMRILQLNFADSPELAQLT